jgi:hypothetical protein
MSWLGIIYTGSLFQSTFSRRKFCEKGAPPPDGCGAWPRPPGSGFLVCTRTCSGTFVTTMQVRGVDLGDVQIAARHADPRTTMRYDRARKNLDRHPNYILAAYMASGT